MWDLTRHDKFIETDKEEEQTKNHLYSLKQ